MRVVTAKQTVITRGIHTVQHSIQRAAHNPMPLVTSNGSRCVHLHQLGPRLAIPAVGMCKSYATTGTSTPGPDPDDDTLLVVLQTCAAVLEAHAGPLDKAGALLGDVPYFPSGAFNVVDDDEPGSPTFYPPARLIDAVGVVSDSKANLGVQAALVDDKGERGKEGVRHGNRMPSNRSYDDWLPCRPEQPVLLSPREMPNASKCGVPLNVYLLHALAHIEINAMDMYCDTVLLGHSAAFHGKLGRGFADDFFSVAQDEARHATWLINRLRELGYDYGAIPAHNALWDYAISTGSRGDLLGRLAVIPLVQEARALDSGDRLISKLRSVGDVVSADIVQQIVYEEVRHVSLGIQWFRYLCQELDGRSRPDDVVGVFHELVKRYVSSPLPGPFNEASRMLADMSPEWYIPVSREARTSSQMD